MDFDQKVHRFGGDWTTRKLDAITEYLQAYLIALKKQGFEKFYIDAFAGTGDREAQRKMDDLQEALFSDLDAGDHQNLLDGSVKRALSIEPFFDRYIFIERSPARCTSLQKLRTEFTHLSDRIIIQQGDANEEIRKICLNVNWKSRRAVLFLDPYGLQVEWTTLEAIAKTRAIDLFILFPLGIGVNRLLTRTGDIRPSWRNRLNVLLGTEDWYNEFYHFESEPTLFGDENIKVTKATTEVIGRFFNDRLKTIFAGVAEKPGVLVNSRNNPLYLLCFAVGNNAAKKVALPIANHLLKKLH